MMVRNRTDHSIWCGGAEVPARGTARVRDDEGVRELIRSGALAKESTSTSSDGDKDDKKKED